MIWWVRWDGATLIVAQRLNGFACFGVFASWLVFGVARHSSRPNAL